VAKPATVVATASPVKGVTPSVSTPSVPGPSAAAKVVGNASLPKSDKKPTGDGSQGGSKDSSPRTEGAHLLLFLLPLLLL
jgi:hypothetical protein